MAIKFATPGSTLTESNYRDTNFKCEIFISNFFEQVLKKITNVTSRKLRAI